MKPPSKKGSENTKARPRRAVVKTSLAEQAQTIAEVRQELAQSLQRENSTAKELREALEQQTATSEILRVIASSPNDLQPVFDAIVESASRLCKANLAWMSRSGGNRQITVAFSSAFPAEIRELISQGTGVPGEGSIHNRAVVERQIIHIPDTTAEPELLQRSRVVRLTNSRSVLAAPLLCDGLPIGAIVLTRYEVRPFSEREIALVKTFADQAVIAIENVRLFNELKESLEQQTATSEILGVIASSPTDIQPVLDVVAENASRLCDANDAIIYRVESDHAQPVAHYGPVPALQNYHRPLSRGLPVGRTIIDRQTIHIHDVAAEIETEFPDARALQRDSGTRTMLVTPLLREDIPIGAISIRRTEVRPFAEKHISLLKTFAAQAVIAIENVRLFKELEERNRDLTEALEQQTATSKILEVIASSPTDVQPVLEAIAESATRLCDGTDAHISHVDGEILRLNAHTNDASLQRDVPITRNHIAGQAILDRRTIHIHDLAAEPEDKYGAPRWRSLGFRTVLIAPLLREAMAIGTITIRRTEVRPFTEKQVALLETFANQAVIAIENVRLFKEIQERNAELREALEHQTATAEVLGIISRSPTDVQPVLDAIVESAARVCGIDDVLLRLHEGNKAVPRAHFGPIPIGRGEISIDEPRFRWMREHGTLHVPDVRERNELQIGRTGRWRTLLSVPLRQQGEFIGSLGARRIEVRPFTPVQIKLLETFADQAVIAIENVRLFQELKEALEQQTATSEILGVIASSPTDIQPVLDAIADSAARVCNADDASIRIVEDNILRLTTHKGSIPFFMTVELPISRGSVAGRAVIDNELIHIEDMTSLNSTEFPDAQVAVDREGVRTILVAPLEREGLAIGVILIRRTEVRPFTEKQIALLKTFADQAVIAIENVRLFQELQARTRELVRSVEELKALGEVGQAVSSTLELETVLTRIASHAVQLSGADGGAIYEYDEPTQEFHLRGSHQIEKELVEALRTSPIQLGWGAVGQAAVTRAPVQVTDILDEREYANARFRPMLGRLGYRSLIAVPAPA